MKNLIKHLILALLFVLAIVYFVLYFIEVWTHHNQYITVPQITQLPIDQAQKILQENHLRFQIIDSSDYDPSLPKNAVVAQNPKAFSSVKENRKIYLTINPSDYRKVTLPRIIQMTKRNAESTLKAVGLEIGEISYKNHIGKDMVLEMYFNGNEVFIGDKLPLKSKIDLICGNGNDTVTDTLSVENQQITPNTP